MISKEKIEDIMQTTDLSERKNALYEAIYEELGQKSYYPIFGLKFYISASESDRHSVIQEVIDLMYDKEFKIYFSEYEKPKIHNGKVFSYVGNFSQPEHSEKEERVNKDCLQCKILQKLDKEDPDLAQSMREGFIEHGGWCTCGIK